MGFLKARKSKWLLSVLALGVVVGLVLMLAVWRSHGYLRWATNPELIERRLNDAGPAVKYRCETWPGGPGGHEVLCTLADYEIYFDLFDSRQARDEYMQPPDPSDCGNSCDTDNPQGLQETCFVQDRLVIFVWDYPVFGGVADDVHRVFGGRLDPGCGPL